LGARDNGISEFIAQQCQQSKIPVSVKQLGANAYYQGQQFKTRDKKGGEIEEFPQHLKLQEFPLPVRN
jgi:hypothetical protein